MILGYLLLSHLLADFVLQPKKLVLWKIKSKLGTLVHAVIHFVVLTLAFLPIIIVNGYYWILAVLFGLALAHFVIDEAKIHYSLKHTRKIKPFIADQLLHVLTLLLAYFLISKESIYLPQSTFYAFYTDIHIIILLCLLVFFGTVIDIYRQQKNN